MRLVADSPRSHWSEKQREFGSFRPNQRESPPRESTGGLHGGVRSPSSTRLSPITAKKSGKSARILGTICANNPRPPGFELARCRKVECDQGTNREFSGSLAHTPGPADKND